MLDYLNTRKNFFFAIETARNNHPLPIVLRSKSFFFVSQEPFPVCFRTSHTREALEARSAPGDASLSPLLTKYISNVFSISLTKDVQIVLPMYQSPDLPVQQIL